MKAQDLKAFNDPPNICLVGEAGAGKTALLSQIGSGGYIFDFDKGMRTALTLEDKFTPFRQATEFDIYVDDDPRIPKKWSQAKQKLREFIKTPPRAVGVDSLTGMAQAIKLYCMHTQAGDALAEPSRQHWGSMINEIEWFMVNLRALKCLVIISAHLGVLDKTKTAIVNGKTVEIPFTVNIINSITRNHGRNKLAWLMDEVSYMERRPVGGGKFSFWVTGEAQDIPARTRSGIFSPMNITDIGLKGYLEKVGFSYEPRAEEEKK